MSRRRALLLLLALATVAMSGCLAGERPPITTLYPDPTSQAPSVSGQAPLVSGSATRVESYEFYGPPGTTFYYGEEPVQPLSPDYGHGSYTTTTPRDRVYAHPSRPGQPRYVYPSGEIRCDNLERSCIRWSGRQGGYVLDDNATRKVYGDRAAERNYLYYRQQ